MDTWEGTKSASETKIIKNLRKSKENKLFSHGEGDSLYYIIKKIKLIIRIRSINLENDSMDPPELLSIDENVWEDIGRALGIKPLRDIAFYFIDYGAATIMTLIHRLKIPEATVYRYIKELRSLGFIRPAIKVKKTRFKRGGSKRGGPRPTIWQVPDATMDQIHVANALHRKLSSPKYAVAEEFAQMLLAEYLEPRGEKEITYRELLIQAREHNVSYRAVDIALLAAEYLSDFGIKVWR